jgi:hypothetical protein
LEKITYNAPRGSATNGLSPKSGIWPTIRKMTYKRASLQCHQGQTSVTELNSQKVNRISDFLEQGEGGEGVREGAPAAGKRRVRERRGGGD